MVKKLCCFFVLAFSLCAAFGADSKWTFASYQTEFSSPSHLITVSEWKFQFPGGSKMAEEKQLSGFSSKYYSVFKDEGGTEWIHFALDAGDKGHSKNTKYVRSELRHLENWDMKGFHRMSYTFKAFSDDKSAKFTVGQIHCVPDEKIMSGEHSPLLRIAVADGKIRAWIKNYSDGSYKSPVLGAYSYGEEKSVGIETTENILAIYMDGRKVFQEEVFCPFKNYFKIGVYPQQTHGFFDVLIKDLKVEVK
ncbi:polysaccharide lyase family 7 protein [Treponema sp.]|uniref:polysaccharide lyase family 7 protein n=1 Tax=Treponema sp. TaxID=166 RepID=UPI00388EEC81